MSQIKIGGLTIGGPGDPVLIIAEMSGNHNQSLERALAIVDAAADSGVHAIKLQTLKPELITINERTNGFSIEDSESLWHGSSLFELYEKAYTPWEWHRPLMERAAERNLICFSSPFDVTAVDFLETLNVPAYKIASFENIDKALIQKVAATGKPVIISTGMASITEIAEAVETVRSTGNNQIVLLKCTSTYPASPENTNLLTMPNLREIFGCLVGISDHTMGIGVSVAAAALGASVIEKHFTLRRADGGIDSAFSMEPAEMKHLVIETNRASLALGKVSYGPTSSEIKSMVFRRSLYVVADLQAGDVLDYDNIRSIRPGKGLPPKFLEIVIGMRVTRNVRRGEPLSWSMLR